MNDNELTLHLFAAKDALLAAEAKCLRRKPHPTELVEAAKTWATKLLDAVQIYPGPAKRPAGLGTMLQRAALTNGKAGPQHYAPQITAAESILTIIEHLKEPMVILLAFQKAFPEFAGVKCVLPYIRTVVGKNGRDLYFLYRRQSVKPAWERMLPSDPTSAEFMEAYRQAEADFEARTRKNYYREPATLAAAA
jgi:hypothetical protein